jgi:hypothetical protein
MQSTAFRQICQAFVLAREKISCLQSRNRVVNEARAARQLLLV